MSRHFFVSDTHWGHANILKYCVRPFLSDEELHFINEGQEFKVSRESLRIHDETILDNINEVVRPKDILWHLGDFAWGDYETVKYYRNKIKCRTVNLIWGNHDQRSIKNLFSETFDQVMIKVNGYNIMLNHYPMRSWDKSHYGSWQLYGHVHGAIPDDPTVLQIDVGVDSHSFQPWSFEQIEYLMKKKYELWKEGRAKWRSKEKGAMKPVTIYEIT